MSQRLTSIAVLLSIALLLAPAGSQATKYAADFITTGTGARPLAMGSAFAAVGDDPNMLFFNPAALGAMGGTSFNFTHSERFGGLVQVDDLSFQRAVNLYGREAGVGFMILRLGVDNIQFTGSPEDHGWIPEDEDDEFGPEDLDDISGLIDPSLFKTVSDQEWAFLGTYSTGAKGWYFGGTLKVIYQSVGEFNSFGFGLDAGVFKPDLPAGFRLGLKVEDITGTYVSWSTGVSEYLPPSLRPALAWYHDFEGLGASLLLAGDAEMRFQNYQEAATWSSGKTSVDPHAGAELWILHTVAMRIGVDGEAWTAGGGLSLSGRGGLLPWDFFQSIDIDYGFSSHEDLDGSHRIGLGMSF